MSLEEIIEQGFETFVEENYKDIRYGYEEILLEQGYARHTLSETNDGRDEYCWVIFVNEYFGTYKTKEEFFKSLQ